VPDEFKGVRGWFRGMGVLFRNRPFVLAMLIFLLCWVAIQLIQSSLLLYMKYVLEKESHFSYFLLVIQVCICSIPSLSLYLSLSFYISHM
jgi:Na+/melibiose symporter-like transporter